MSLFGADVESKVIKEGFADAVDVYDVFGVFEIAVLLTVGDYFLGSEFADSRQKTKSFFVGGVDVYGDVNTLGQGRSCRYLRAFGGIICKHRGYKR